MTKRELCAKLSEFDDDTLIIVEVDGTAKVFFEADTVDPIHYDPESHEIDSMRTDQNAVLITWCGLGEKG